MLSLFQAAAASSGTSSSADTALLQQQLHVARAELQHTQALLDELMLEHSAAVKAACEQRSGALRLLLAQQTKELHQAEQHRVAAQELAAAKASGRQCVGSSIVGSVRNTFIGRCCQFGHCCALAGQPMAWRSYSPLYVMPPQAALIWAAALAC